MCSSDLLGLHVQPLPQVQVQLAQTGGAVFLQAQLLELTVKVLLHAGAAHPLGKKADFLADLRLRRRQSHLRKIPVAHDGDRGVPQV